MENFPGGESGFAELLRQACDQGGLTRKQPGERIRLEGNPIHPIETDRAGLRLESTPASSDVVTTDDESKNEWPRAARFFPVRALTAVRAPVSLSGLSVHL